MCCNKAFLLIISLIIVFVIINSFIICFYINSFQQQNILQASNSQIQEGNGLTPLILNTNSIQKGNAILHENSDPEIRIVKSGIYLVNYTVTGSLETGGDPTSFDVSLYQDNVLVPNSILSSLVIPSGQLTSLSGSILIEVNGSSMISLVGFSSSNIVYQDVIISIIKLS